MNNFMKDPLIRVATATGGGVEGRTLPGVLAGLVKDEVVSFAALRPHQSHPWHAFLVQLAAIALHQANLESPPADEATWCDLLRNLTIGWPEDEPWQLIVADLAKPAFLQPPVPEKTLNGFKTHYLQPDRIDVLVTAKNHDVKMARMGHPRPDHWLMALVSLQTMAGFLGVGNYGIARMNGGFASRPGVGVRPSPIPSSHFRHDLMLLQRYRYQLANDYPNIYRQSSGISLLWLLPWDGQTSLSLTELDPYFIEVCRRIRLVFEPDGIVARGTTSKSSRIHAKEFRGNLGDPWTPLRDDTSLTITDKGFDYALVANLILGGDKYRSAPAQSQGSGTHGEDMEFWARALTRGQGQTGGYYERRVPIPSHVEQVLVQPSEREFLAGVAKNRVKQCDVMAKHVLKPAILTMIQMAPDKLNFNDRRADPWLTHLDHRVDDSFFPSLWRSLEMSEEEAQTDWLHFLREAAKEIMEAAKKSLTGGGARRYKIFAVADLTFYGSLCKQFPIFRTNKGLSTDEANT